MLFDLTGRGRRRTVRVIYGGLALLFLLGFVGFGVGSLGSGGGFVEAIFGGKGEGGGGGASYGSQLKKARQLTVTQPNNAAAWSGVIHFALLEAGNGENFNSTENSFTAKAQPLLKEVQAAWERYLKLTPRNPSAEVAAEVLRVYATAGGINDPTGAVKALKIEIAGTASPSATQYYRLAQAAYLANDKAEGARASKLAIKLAPAGEKTILENYLAQVKSAAAKSNKLSVGKGGSVTFPASALPKSIAQSAAGGKTVTIPASALPKGVLPPVPGGPVLRRRPRHPRRRPRHPRSRQRRMALSAVSGDAQTPPYTGRLLVDCADRPGIVAAVSGFLFAEGANIVSSHQYSSDPSGGRFFLRTEFFLDRASAGEPRESETPGEGAESWREEFRERFRKEVAGRFEMEWGVRFWGERRRVAILVSRHDHCLVDLLWRHRRGELDATLVAVVSNHPDLRQEVEGAGVVYRHVPVGVGEEGRRRAEQEMLELLAGQVDLVVLARYMQILSGPFLRGLGVPVINIHHSFLPAFAGAEPYRRARQHGVKLIGATAHYVTEELDAGPIIEQGVERVDHTQSVAELERVGRDIERVVLARAVALHLDDRVLVDGGRTVVF